MCQSCEPLLIMPTALHAELQFLLLIVLSYNVHIWKGNPADGGT